MKILKFICSRSLVILLFILLISFPLVNYKKVKTADKAKLLYFEHPKAYQELVSYLKEDKLVDKEKLAEYAYYLEKLREQRSNDADILHILGIVYYLNGDLEKSKNVYSEGLQKYPKNLWFNYNVAVGYYLNNQYEQANRVLLSAITVAPDEAFGFFKVSQKILVPILLQAKVQPIDLRRNIKELYRDIYSMLVLVNYQLKDYEQMRKMAQRALVTNVGHDGDFFFYAGLANHLLGEDRLAVESFQKALEKRIDLVEGYEYLNQSLIQLGRQQEAVEAINKAKEFRLMKTSDSLLEQKFQLRIF